MDIGGIVARCLFGSAEPARTERVTSPTGFSRRLETAMRPESAEREQPSFVLHKDGDEGDALVGVWASGDGSSVSVFRPADFDPAHPVCKARMWDADGGVSDRLVDVSAVDPRSADAVEMFALSGGTSADGGFDMLSAFMSAQGMREHFGVDDGLDAKIDWISLVNDAMYAQQGAGNMRGVRTCRSLLDALLAV